MSKKLILDERFAVRNQDALVSNLWWLKATRGGQVYFGTTGFGHLAKYSLHASAASRICRYAAPNNDPRKPILRWSRDETPSSGAGRAIRASWIAIPSDYLSRNEISDGRGIRWISAAPPGKATYLELIYTRENRACLVRALEHSPRTLLASAELPTGELFAILLSEDDWDNKDLYIPAKGDAPGYLFSVRDPEKTGRPARIVVNSNPKDGDAILLYELGGYHVNFRSPQPSAHCATLERLTWTKGSL